MPPTIQPELVTTNTRLESLAQTWAAGEAIAVDTEFVRTRTFYPKLGLVQIAGPEGIALLDPVALPDLDPMLEVFASPRVLKVFHSCGEDLEVIYHLAGRFPEPLFDTQLAAAFCGHGHSLGYGPLVGLLRGVDLPKGETRTDWLRRPLSEAQVRYAAQDVAHLLPMQEELAASLEELGRTAWLTEEISRLFAVDRFHPPPEEAYRRIKQHHSLSRRGLAILMLLSRWREAEARRRDLPRGFLLQDKVLMQLARNPPRNSRQLAATPLLPPPAAKRLGATLLRLIHEGLEIPSEELPAAPKRRFDTSSHKKAIQALRNRASERAAELDLPPELLATRRQVEGLFARVAQRQNPPLPSNMLGWRREAIGDELVHLAERALRR